MGNNLTLLFAGIAVGLCLAIYIQARYGRGKR